MAWSMHALCLALFSKARLVHYCGSACVRDRDHGSGHACVYTRQTPNRAAAVCACAASMHRLGTAMNRYISSYGLRTGPPRRAGALATHRRRKQHMHRAPHVPSRGSATRAQLGGH